VARHSRGQAEFKVVAALLNVSAVAAVTQAVGDSLPVVPDTVWHAGTWVMAVLVALAAFFVRRMVNEVERDIEAERQARCRMEAELRQCVTKLAVIETTCAMRHGHSSGGETRP
jgi:membrane protein implicated in regulation of membrane protease activity